METIENNPKTQKHLKLIVDKLSNESYKPKLQKRRKANAQNKNYEKMVKVLGGTIESFDEENETKVDKYVFITEIIRIRNGKISEEIIKETSLNFLLGKKTKTVKQNSQITKK